MGTPLHRRAAITICRVGVRCNGRADDTLMTKTPAVPLEDDPSTLTPERPGKDAPRSARRPVLTFASRRSLHFFTLFLSTSFDIIPRSSSYAPGSRVRKDNLPTPKYHPCYDLTLSRTHPTSFCFAYALSLRSWFPKGLRFLIEPRCCLASISRI